MKFVWEEAAERIWRKSRFSVGFVLTGCPMDVYVEDGKVVSVEGRVENGKSRGLCSKGAASKQYLYNEERILYPMKRVGERGSGEFERISWEEAYDLIVENLNRVKEQYGARSVVFYAGYPKVVQACASAPRECVWESELLYGIEYLLSGFGSGVEVGLRKRDLFSGSGPYEDAFALDEQSVPF